MAEFQIEKEDRLARMGGSKRSRASEEEEDPKGPPESQGQLKSPWDRPKPKKGTYPKVGPKGPGDLNLEGDWEGPIELFEFEDIEEGWVNCTTGYYWHSILGGGICQHADEWYRNWEFDYKPPDKEVVPKELEEEIPDVPQDPLEEEEDIELEEEIPDVPQDPPEEEENIAKQIGDTGRKESITPGLTLSQQGESVQSKMSGYHTDTPITIKAEPSIWPTATFINIHEHPI